MKKRILVLFVLVLFCVAFVFAGGEKESDKAAADDGKMKVAFVYNASVGDFGWFYGHDRSRKLSEEALDFITTQYLENVAPGAQAERVLKELCDDGYDVIVAASADYEADVVKVAENYPKVKFLICAGTIAKDPNIESFFPKTSQVWYLLGQVAAKLTKTNTLGMVGAVVHPLDLQVQNAFMLGARSINPKIVQRIIYINTYYDPAAERDAALSLIDAGADVIAQATNTPAHVQAAEEMGVYAMSQFEDMREFGPNAFISGDVFYWEKYYIPTFTAIREGTWKPSVVAPDITTGVCDLAPFGKAVTPEMVALVEKTKAYMVNTDPEFFWKGPIYNNKGELVVPEGKQLTEQELLSMNWWVDGIITSMK